MMRIIIIIIIIIIKVEPSYAETVYYRPIRYMGTELIIEEDTSMLMSRGDLKAETESE